MAQLAGMFNFYDRRSGFACRDLTPQQEQNKNICMGSRRENPVDMARLRHLIGDIERRWRAPGDAGATPLAAWLSGAEAIDAALPAAGLSRAALHEFAGPTPVDAALAAGFAAVMTGRLDDSREIVWCQTCAALREHGCVYGPGLAALGLDPGRVVFVAVRRPRDVVWAMEEALRSQALAAVIGEGPAMDFTASRRLALAAHKAMTPAVSVSLGGDHMPSAAATRWRVRALAGRRTGPAPGVAAMTAASGWDVRLERCRHGRSGRWLVVWNHETHSFDLAAPFRNRPIAAQGPADRRRAG